MDATSNGIKVEILHPGSNIKDLLADLKECSITRNLEKGKQVHAAAMEYGHDSNIYVASALMNMYAKCGSMTEAHVMFDSLIHPNVVSWNVLILGYAVNGQGTTALGLFTRMTIVGPAPNYVTFLAALKACTSLGAAGCAECRERGKEIHDLAVKSGCDSYISVQNSLIDMYAKCGSMEAAQQLFDSIQHPDVVSWNVLILGYADAGQAFTALGILKRMRHEGLEPDSASFLAALKVCTFVEWGEIIHNLARENGCDSVSNVQNTLIDMYARCRSMVNARQVFDSMKRPGVVSWNALILGYAENGQGPVALDLFMRMKNEGTAPDSVTLLGALKAYTSLGSGHRDGIKEIHKLAVDNENVYVQNALIDMYAKCDSMADARHVFDCMKHPNKVSWTILIQGYADNSEGIAALDMFKKMKHGDHAPDSVTLVAALKACTSLVLNDACGRLECRDRGKEIHHLAVKNGWDSDMYVQSTLIDMYSKCGSMVDARQVFDSMKHPNVVSWTALILGYADNGQGLAALDIFMKMRNRGLVPDSVTFAAALRVCALLGALDFGRKLHSEIENGNLVNMVLVNCLVDFYAKCGSMLEAQSVFDSHGETRDLLTWTTLLAGYSNCGYHESMFRVFKEMQDGGFLPDSVTFRSILMCCNHAGLVEKGKECFDAISMKYGIIPAVEHYTCMVDMFGRANKLDDAMGLLKGMPCSPDDATWTIILSSCIRWKSVEIGRLAFQTLISFNDRNAAAYVLMGQIYGIRGMLQEQDLVMAMRRHLPSS